MSQVQTPSALSPDELYHKVVSHFSRWLSGSGWHFGTESPPDPARRTMRLQMQLYRTGTDTLKGAGQVGLKLLGAYLFGGTPKGPCNAGKTWEYCTVRITSAPTVLHLESALLEHDDVKDLWSRLVTISNGDSPSFWSP